MQNRAIKIPRIFGRSKKVKVEELVVPVAVNLYDRDIAFVNFIEKLTEILSKEDNFQKCLDFIIGSDVNLTTYTEELRSFIQSQDTRLLSHLYHVVTHSLQIDVTENNKLILYELATVLSNRKLLLDYSGDLYESVIESTSRIHDKKAKQVQDLILHLNDEATKNVDILLENGIFTRFIRKLCYILHPKIIYTLVHTLVNKLDLMETNDFVMTIKLLYTLKINNSELMLRLLLYASDIKRVFGSDGSMLTRFFNNLLLFEDNEPNIVVSYFNTLKDRLDDIDDKLFVISNLPSHWHFRRVQEYPNFIKCMLKDITLPCDFETIPDDSEYKGRIYIKLSTRTLTHGQFFNYIRAFNRSDIYHPEINEVLHDFSQRCEFLIKEITVADVIIESLCFLNKTRLFNDCGLISCINANLNNIDPIDLDKILSLKLDPFLMSKISQNIWNISGSNGDVSIMIKGFKYLKHFDNTRIAVSDPDLCQGKEGLSCNWRGSEIPEHIVKWLDNLHVKYTQSDKIVLNDLIKIIVFFERLSINHRFLDEIINDVAARMEKSINNLSINAIFKLPDRHRILIELYKLYTEGRISRLHHLIEFYICHCKSILGGSDSNLNLETLTDDIFQTIVKLDKSIHDTFINRCLYNPQHSANRVNPWNSTELRLLFNKPVEPFDDLTHPKAKYINQILNGNSEHLNSINSSSGMVSLNTNEVGSKLEKTHTSSITSLSSLQQFLHDVSLSITDLDLEASSKREEDENIKSVGVSLHKIGTAIRQCLLTTAMNAPTLRDINLPKRHAQSLVACALNKFRDNTNPLKGKTGMPV